MKTEFEVKVTLREVYDFMLYHMYCSFVGISGTIIGLIVFMGGLDESKLMTERILFITIGCLIMLGLPVSMYLKAKQQALNPEFQLPVHYVMSEAGVEMTRGEIKEFTKWESFGKVMSSKKSIFLYTSNKKAMILPKNAIEEQYEQILDMIALHIASGKVRIR